MISLSLRGLVRAGQSGCPNSSCFVDKMNMGENVPALCKYIENDLAILKPGLIVLITKPMYFQTRSQKESNKNAGAKPKRSERCARTYN